MDLYDQETACLEMDSDECHLGVGAVMPNDLSVDMMQDLTFSLDYDGS